jgi:hypothetical protein
LKEKVSKRTFGQNYVLPGLGQGIIESAIFIHKQNVVLRQVFLSVPFFSQKERNEIGV